MSRSIGSSPTERPINALRKIAPGRSCIACRRRKIRCNRQHPCGYCTRLKVPCSYPDDHDTRLEDTNHEHADLLERLCKVEESLRQLQDGRDSAPPATLALQARPVSRSATANPATSTYGQVFRSDNSSRYVDGGLWASIENVSRRVDGTPKSSAQTEDALNPPGSTLPFGSPIIHDLSQLHPRNERIFPLWQVYLENVNPVLRILHVPTTQRQLLQASQSLEGIPPSFEALMFAIYYAAVTSMQTSTHSEDSGERWSLLDKHGSGVEQALAKANFMLEPDLFALQALLLYLLCARTTGHRSAGMVWTMTSIAVQLARRLGCHRDLRRLGASPFESEMASRLWWNIVVLDTLSAQDNDLDPGTQIGSFDTPLPHNVDDQVLEPSMSVSINDSEQRTEMVFALRLIQMVRSMRQTMFSNGFDGSESLSPTAKLAKTEVLDQHFEQLDRRILDTNTALCSFTRIFTSLEILRTSMGIKVMDRVKTLEEDPGQEGSAKAILDDATAILNGLQITKSSNGQRKFMWLVQRNVERDAVAAILHCLVTDEHGCGLTDETWQMISDFFAHSSNDPQHEGAIDHRWQLLQKLFNTASMTRMD